MSQLTVKQLFDGIREEISCGDTITTPSKDRLVVIPAFHLDYIKHNLNELEEYVEAYQTTIKSLVTLVYTLNKELGYDNSSSE